MLSSFESLNLSMFAATLKESYHHFFNRFLWLGLRLILLFLPLICIWNDTAYLLTLFHILAIIVRSRRDNLICFLISLWTGICNLFVFTLRLVRWFVRRCLRSINVHFLSDSNLFKEALSSYYLLLWKWLLDQLLLISRLHLLILWFWHDNF